MRQAWLGGLALAMLTGVMLTGVMLAGAMLAGAAQAADCGPWAGKIVDVALPGRPFSAVESRDGCAIFVSLSGKAAPGIAVLLRKNGTLVLSHVEKARAPFKLALTGDGHVLIAADGDGASFFDADRLIADSGAAELGHIDDGGKDAIYLALTPDEATLFVSDERSQSIGVIDFAKARAGGFGAEALLGSIKVGNAPVGLAVSPDGTTLYATNEIVHFKEWPGGCKDEQGKSDRLHPQGVLAAFNVAAARTTPDRANAGVAPAGCNPVRVVLSPAGERAYVTARGEDAVLVFDTALLRNRKDALIGKIPVGPSPVGMAMTADGKRLVVTNSDRFAKGASGPQKLQILDATAIGAEAVIGSVEAGIFPRELCITHDGLLLVTNAGSGSLTVVPLAALPDKAP